MANLTQGDGRVARSPGEVWWPGTLPRGRLAVRGAVLAVAAGLVLALVVRQVSPAVVGFLMEHSRPSYFRVEAAYVLPAVAFLCVGSLCGLAACIGSLRGMLGWALTALAFATICAVLILDSNTDFTTEAGKITIFTTTALVLCSIVSGVNCAVTPGPRRVSRVFWGVLAVAFLFAAADEALMIHERVGAVASWLLGVESEAQANQVQDDVTLTYAVGALTFLAVTAASMRAAQRNRHAMAWLGIAALVYFASTLLDSLNGAIRSPPLAIVDLRHLANTVEEMLEFLAAMLFLFGCLLGLLEREPTERFVAAAEQRMASWPSRPARAAAALGLGLFLFAGLAAAVLVPDRDARFLAEGLRTEFFTGTALTPLHPDGIASASNGVYVANDHPASLAALDPKHGTRAIATTAHEPESILVGNDGRIYVSDEGRGEVYAMVPGQTASLLLDRSDGLRAPKGLAVGPRGELYVADAGASAIFRYADGKLSIFASSLNGVAAPEEMAFDSAGNLYVTEAQKRVVRLSPDGAMGPFLNEREGFTPEAIAIAGDRIFITDSGRGAVLEYGRDGRGRVLATLSPRLGRTLEGVAVTPDGAVWVGLRPPMEIPGAVLRIAPQAPRLRTASLNRPR